MSKTNRKYKDRLFIFIFGNESIKEFTLSLYNAINDTNYDDPNLITFNTIDDFIYMGVKNDVSFLISDTVNVYEHQSTFSSNMPIRMLLYLAKIYESIIDSGEKSIYQESAVNLPTPKLVVFYNGKKNIEDIKIQKLSDLVNGKSDVEVNVKMLNINYGHNRELMEKCKPLMEYSKLIYLIRENLENGENIYDAIDNAIMSLDNDSLIKPFILAHKSEVVSMLFTMENEAREMEKYYNGIKKQAYKEGYIEGFTYGFVKGFSECFVYFENKNIAIELCANSLRKSLRNKNLDLDSKEIEDIINKVKENLKKRSD